MRNHLRLLAALTCLSGLLLAQGCDHTVESPAITADPPGVSGQPGPVAPDLVCAEELTTALTISGDGFTPFPTQTLQDTIELLLPIVDLTRTKAIDGTAATGAYTVPDDVKAPADSHVRWMSEQKMGFDVFPDLALEPGLYDIKVTNRDLKHSADFPGAFAAVPRPIITKVAPDILCDAQSDQTVTITGTGFLDVGGTLAVVHYKGLDLPIQSVDGCIEVPGAHSAGIVRTCTTAVFVIPMGSCDPGTALLTLTNPATAACTSKVEDQVTITVVPPPSVLAIVPDLICDAQGDQAMIISGADFLQMGSALPVVTVGTQTYPATGLTECTEIVDTVTGKPFAEGAVQKCNKLQFTIGQGTLPPGKYSVMVTNPAPAACHSVETLELTVVEPPVVVSITPDLICDAQGDQAMVLTGTGFLQFAPSTGAPVLPSVTVGDKTYTPSAAEGCTVIPGNFTEGVVSACTTLRFTISMGDLPEGDYAVMVTNPPPANCSSTDAVNLHVAPPPAITGLDRSAICDEQASQDVTVIGTGFLSVGGVLPTVTIDGDDYTPTAATGCTTVPGTFAEGTVQECTGLTVSIPQGALGTGSYPITVTNPAPADCTTTSSVSLQVFPPPTVATITPASICTNGGTLTITGSGFGPDTTVTLVLAGQADVVATDVTVNAAGTQLTAQIPLGAEAPNDYDVVVNNGCEDRPLPHKKVHIVPGPKLFFADPEVVYNGINTRVTLYVTALTLPLTAVSITPSGGGTPINLTFTLAANNKVQVIIPAGTPPGSYDLSLADSVACPAQLAGAITVTDSLTISIARVVPPFGWTLSNTDVTIFRDTAAAAPLDKPFVAVPRVFLNPANATGTEPAIQLTATSMSDADTLTSVIPKGNAVGTYDLIVVNPDGAVGVLADAFEVTADPPPVVTSVTPASVVNATGQNLVVAGTDFRGATLSFVQCADVAGTPIATLPAITTGTLNCTGTPPGTTCTLAGVMNAGGLPAGASCVVQVTNDDGTWAIYSAVGVTGSSLNLSAPRVSSPMTVGRRALVSAAGDATQAARYVYAIGGDTGGATPTTLDTVESAPVDVFGNMGTWSLQRHSLGGPRAFAAAAQLGRYTYLCGGTDGTAPLASCKRAMILDPLEKPVLDVADLLVKDTGLDPGYWFYRIAATYSAADLDNPNGESLPSDEIVVKVPALQAGKKVQIVLAWTPPTDSKAVALPNVSGYRIYRTAAVNGAANSEVLLTTVSGTTLQYTDDGTATPGTETFLPLGSTGTWADLPAMGTARQGLAMTWAADPATPGLFYVYSFFGKTGATTASATYEFLPVTVLANGHQTAAGAWTAGAASTTVARWQIAAFRGDSTLSSLVTSPDTWIWIGGGLDAAGTTSTPAKRFDAGKVAAGGDLGTFASPSGFSSAQAGYGAVAANGELFTFGGANAAPSAKAKSTVLEAPAPALGNWNDEGLVMTESRYLMGTAVQSAYIFLVGGATATSPASNTTEVVIW